MTTTQVPPRERPIIFSGAMVRALLSGAKTQTRRIVKPAPGQRVWLNDETIHQKVLAWKQAIGERSDGSIMRGDWWAMSVGYQGDPAAGHIGSVRCPYGVPGDRLWVRETWADLSQQRCEGGYRGGLIGHAYRADGFDYYGEWDDPDRVDAGAITWRPSIHMPRRSSRILLEIVTVRVERLCSISEDDARAEGIAEPDVVTGYTTSGKSWAHPFFRLWDSINGPDAFKADPWVWVIEFRRVEPGAAS